MINNKKRTSPNKILSMDGLVKPMFFLQNCMVTAPSRIVYGSEDEKISSGEVGFSDTITRITIDLDTKDIKTLIHCLKTLKRYGFTEDLVVRESASRHGFHVIAWNKYGVSLKKLMKIRRKCFDDEIRIKLDNIQGRQIQVLFTKKRVEVKKDD